MGEYADMAFEQEFDNHIDWLLDGPYGEEEDYSQTNYVTVKDANEYEFKTIKKETQKAWLLIMNGGNEMWFPKSHCTIKDNMIIIPTWLVYKKIAEGN